MIRALWFMIKVAIVVGIAVWVADRPGTIRIEWLNYDLTVHVGLFLLILIGLMIVAMTVFHFIYGLVSFPQTWRRYRDYQSRDKGYRALTRGLTAVAAGDAKEAAKQARRAQDNLPEDKGLPLLLAGQAARLEGREEEACKHFAALLEHKDAGFLGVRGLMQAAMDAGDQDTALTLAQRALKLYPKQHWILLLVYELELKARRWDTARATLRRAERVGALEVERVKEDRAAIYTAQADAEVESGFPEQAIRSLEKARKAAPEFIPAATRLAKLYIQAGKRRKAQRLIEAVWKRHSHPDLALYWGMLVPPGKSKDPMAKLKWMEKLCDLNSKSAAGHIALAEVAMDKSLWGEARTHLLRALEIAPDGRVYRMLAKLEEQGAKDDHAANEWLEKAADAPAESRWFCRETGRVFEDWKAFASAQSGFNTISWGTPDMEKYGAHTLAAHAPYRMLRAV